MAAYVFRYRRLAAFIQLLKADNCENGAAWVIRYGVDNGDAQE